LSSGRVLVVDDEPEIRRAVGRALTARGYAVEAVGNGERAIDVAPTFAPDLVVLDLNMPKVDGLEVCRQIRTWSSVPILVLSVREDEVDKVAALDLGADDYLTKPFGIDELLARVRALLRRAVSPEARKQHRYVLEDLSIDLEERSIVRGDEPVHLTKTEWALLAALASHPGRLLTQRWLLEQVWGPGYREDMNVLRVFVSQLRRKIEPDPASQRIIVTDPGVGYRWVLRPSEVVAPPLI
jgi:two-component system, OmpR family, KDP operon response regulator KdpE